MKEVQNDSMKEVKGLEDRLYGLDQIMSGARKIVQEQAELAQVYCIIIYMTITLCETICRFSRIWLTAFDATFV